jgi:hypothetical protein
MTRNDSASILQGDESLPVDGFPEDLKLFLGEKRPRAQSTASRG